MTRDEIIKLAKDARLCDPSPYIAPWPNQLDAWERFAALVAAAEREACAKACDERAEAWRAAHLAGQRAMQERAAVAAWSSGMDQHKKAVGIPLDSREVGSACASAIRALEVKP